MISNKEEYKKIAEILDDSIIVDNVGDDTLGKDLQEIAKHVTHPENVRRFTRNNPATTFEKSVLRAVSQSNMVEDKIKRYAFIDFCMDNYDIYQSAEKGWILDKFVELSSGLMGYVSAIGYRQAGMEGDKKKLGIVDRIKNL